VSKSPLIWKKEKMMKDWKYFFTLAVLASIAGLLISVVLGEAGRVILIDMLLKIVRFIFGLAVGILLLAFPVLLGIFSRLVFFEILDERVDSDKKLTKLQHYGISIPVALIIGILQVVVVMWAPNISSWVYSVYRFAGWPGAFETPPLWWFVYGFFGSIVSYRLIVES
jgi:hypothetical protein